jgi:hypothetical protein
MKKGNETVEAAGEPVHTGSPKEQVEKADQVSTKSTRRTCLPFLTVSPPPTTSRIEEQSNMTRRPIHSSSTHLCNPRPDIAPHEPLPSLQLCLHNDQFEVGFRIFIACLGFHKLNLQQRNED